MCPDDLFVYNNYVCNDCGYEWLADDYIDSCPNCGSEHIQVGD